MYESSTVKKTLPPIGRNNIFITMPMISPTKELSLCQGTKKFRNRIEIENWSSIIVNTLRSERIYQTGIVMYHHVQISLNQSINAWVFESGVIGSNISFVYLVVSCSWAVICIVYINSLLASTIN